MSWAKRPSRLSGDLVIEARRRAGLTQTELATALGREQSTIARWEGGRNQPTLETVQEVLRVCGLDLGVGVVRFDDSYDTLIDRGLKLGPAERIVDRSRGAFDPLGMLDGLARAGARFVVIGAVAAAAHGSPLALGRRTLAICPAQTEECEDALQNARETLQAELTEPWSTEPWSTKPWEPSQPPWLLPDGARVLVFSRPRGSAGYEDLVRDARQLELPSGSSVALASLLDLIRIAAAASPEHQGAVPALRATRERTVLREAGWQDPRAPMEIVASWQRRVA